MESKEPMETHCKEKSQCCHRQAHSTDNKRPWRYGFIFIACLCMVLCIIFVLNCLYTTRLEVESLKFDVRQLQSQLNDINQVLDQRQPEAAESRTKRSVRQPFEDEAVESGVNNVQPRLPLTRRTTTARSPAPGAGSPSRAPNPRLPGTRPSNDRLNVRRTTTTTTRAPSTDTNQRSGLPIHAYESPNLVVSPEAEREASPTRVGSTGPNVARRPGSNYSYRSSKQGSTFTRWGKVSCPQSSTLVYAGYAGAADPWYNNGGSTGLECLSTYPTWHSNSPTSVQTSTKIFAAKFFLGQHSGIFPQSADNSVITCAVCYTTKAPAITLPGRVDCPGGWYREYHGYLMSSTAIPSALLFSSRNYCIDRNPDYYTGHNDHKGLKLTFLQAGSCYQNAYPCSGYTENHRLGCAVCSKAY